jgi:hypothetical protein
MPTVPAGPTALDSGATLYVYPSVVGCIWCLTGSSDLRRSTCVRSSVSVSCRLYRVLASGASSRTAEVTSCSSAKYS